MPLPTPRFSWFMRFLNKPTKKSFPRLSPSPCLPRLRPSHPLSELGPLPVPLLSRPNSSEEITMTSFTTTMPRRPFTKSGTLLPPGPDRTTTLSRLSLETPPMLLESSPVSPVTRTQPVEMLASPSWWSSVPILKQLLPPPNQDPNPAALDARTKSWFFVLTLIWLVHRGRVETMATWQMQCAWKIYIYSSYSHGIIADEVRTHNLYIHTYMEEENLLSDIVVQYGMCRKLTGSGKISFRFFFLKRRNNI